jgi:glycosyltransferase involved in cell wall biosynthesis
VRVLLVGPYPLDPAVVDSGVQSSFVYLVDGLGEVNGVEPEVISFAHGLARPVHRSDGNGVSITYLPTSGRLSYLTRHAMQRSALRREIEARRPDLVHAQDTLGSGYVSLKSASGAPVVVTVHGITREEVQHLPWGLARARARILGVSIERYCIRHARYLVASTGYPTRYFGTEIRGRISEIDNPISDDFFAVAPRPEPGRVLYAGAIIARKRLLDMVEAMPRLLDRVPTAALRVAGGEPEAAYAASVRARIGMLGLESRVHLLGGLRREALLEEFARASAFVLPSQQETSPLSIGEAMAAALPVVATRVGGVPDLVDEGITGNLVAVGASSALADRLAAILVDPRLRETMGAAAREVAERRFRIDVVAQRFRELYELVRDCGQ